MLLGVHCSIGGGFEKAVAEAKALQINTFQIFTKNQRQWKEKVVTEKEANVFQQHLTDSAVGMVFSHAIYLINVASAKPEVMENSMIALKGELDRCQALGLPYTVLHPGSNNELSKMETADLIAAKLNDLFAADTSGRVKILLENTAGQGSSVGGKFEELRQIMQQLPEDRIGICFDTCHAFAAGYDIRTKTGIEDALDELDAQVGIQNVMAFHLNDSKGDLGSKLDRHHHIGEGKIGLEAFRYIINRFPDVPKVLETPKEQNMDPVNLARLKSLIED